MALCSVRTQGSCTYHYMVNIHLSDYERWFSINKSYTKISSCIHEFLFIMSNSIIIILVSSRSTVQREHIFAFVSKATILLVCRIHISELFIHQEKMGNNRWKATYLHKHYKQKKPQFCQ